MSSKSSWQNPPGSRVLQGGPLQAPQVGSRPEVTHIQLPERTKTKVKLKSAFINSKEHPLNKFH